VYAALSEYASKAGLSGGTVTATWEAEEPPRDSGQGTSGLKKGREMGDRDKRRWGGRSC
jgi:hypothetical protein